jgi:hypothetical protein
VIQENVRYRQSEKPPIQEPITIQKESKLEEGFSDGTFMRRLE